MDKPTTTELLADLREIHLPPAPVEPDLWPVLLSLGICAVAALLLIFRYTQHSRQKQHNWHQPALSSLNRLQQQAPSDALHLTAALLKRVALTEQNNQATKQLNGQPWLRYLDHFFNTDYFTRGEGRIFGDSLYQPESTISDNTYRELKKLIKRHRWRQ